MIWRTSGIVALQQELVFQLGVIIAVRKVRQAQERLPQHR